jgi:Flp pilus assembly protein TadD
MVAPIQANDSFAYGIKHLGQGRPAEAEDCFRRALGLKPDWAEAWHNLAIVLMKQGRVDEASDCYRQALNLK